MDQNQDCTADQESPPENKTSPQQRKRKVSIQTNVNPFLDDTGQTSDPSTMSTPPPSSEGASQNGVKRDRVRHRSTSPVPPRSQLEMRPNRWTKQDYYQDYLDDLETTKPKRRYSAESRPMRPKAISGLIQEDGKQRRVSFEERAYIQNVTVEETLDEETSPLNDTPEYYNEYEEGLSNPGLDASDSEDEEYSDNSPEYSPEDYNEGRPMDRSYLKEDPEVPVEEAPKLRRVHVYNEPDDNYPFDSDRSKSNGYSCSAADSNDVPNSKQNSNSVSSNIRHSPQHIPEKSKRVFVEVHSDSSSSSSDDSVVQDQHSIAISIFTPEDNQDTANSNGDSSDSGYQISPTSPKRNGNIGNIHDEKLLHPDCLSVVNEKGSPGASPRGSPGSSPSSSPRFQKKKIATSSLPAGVVGQCRISQSPVMRKKISTTSLQSLDDTGQPKSILKNRKEDTESLASEESSSKLKFKVRKDSIALFSDKHQDLEELRRQHGGKRFRLTKADFKKLWENRSQLWTKYRLHIVVMSIFLVTLAFVSIGLHYHNVHHENLAIAQKIFFDAKPRTLRLVDQVGSDTFSGKLGLDIPAWMLPKHCHDNYEDVHDRTCVKWKNHAQMEIVYFNENKTDCYNVSWLMLSPDTVPYDCYDIDSSFWYGPSNSSGSAWPLTNRHSMTFRTTSSNHHNSGTLDVAIEYYWLSSRGVAVIVDPNTPLLFDWNNKRANQFCLMAREDAEFYGNSRRPDKMHYTICNGPDLLSTHRYVRNRYLPRLSKIPDEHLLTSPHWSSLGDLSTGEFGQESLIKLSEKITQHKLNCSVLEIDGKWESHYGDFTLNQERFPNMTELVKAAEGAGCWLSLNVFPYFNYHSNNFQEGLVKGYFIRDSGQDVPALLRWQNGVGAMLDITNPAARTWLSNKIINLDFDFQAVRFWYGTLSWIPSQPSFSDNDLVNPNKIKGEFSELMNSFTKGLIQRGTSQSQHIPSLMSVVAKVYRSSHETCITNLISEALILGLIGYPYVMADGVSSYLYPNKNNIVKESPYVYSTKDTIVNELPSRELYIRWMQVASFFPALKFSTPPWAYDRDVVKEARFLSEYHTSYIVNITRQLEPEIKAGMPIIRPIWWVDSKDWVSFQISDQFLVGNSLLVAPVLCEGVTERRVYIPRGIWRDLMKGGNMVVTGPKWITLKVGLYDTPSFEKMKEQYAS